MVPAFDRVHLANCGGSLSETSKKMTFFLSSIHIKISDEITSNHRLALNRLSGSVEPIGSAMKVTRETFFKTLLTNVTSLIGLQIVCSRSVTLNMAAP